LYKITVSKYYPSVGKYYVEIVMDSAEDAQSLPGGYAPSSIAVVADEGMPCWMVNASGEWREL
jgi:hypothetical protein